jgi:hypothetical protein
MYENIYLIYYMERSRSFKSFSTENIDEFIRRCKNQEELLPLYLDRIRNGYLFIDEMIENINNFDEKSKMRIILEYNKIMKVMKDALEYD